MQNDRIRKSAGVTLEGLENRHFFSATPVAIFAPPAFGEGAGMPMPVMFDAGFAPMRGIPLLVLQSAIASNADDTTPAASTAAPTAVATVATSGTFNGYPSASTTVGTSASVSMETVNRAVDAAFVPTGSVQPAGPANASPSTATATIALSTPAAAAVETPATDSASSAPAAAALPDGRIAPPVALFSSAPIQSDGDASDGNAITSSLRSAEAQIACVVRLAWADIAYTRAGESIDRMATEVGQAIANHATEAELAAAMVMGVAGVALWVKQAKDDVAEAAATGETKWVETVTPRPWAG